uniref:tRNA(Ile)-lysidine synthase, chloroplastic n=1 Tax=Chlorokybus atmophyticus TaxID=3144 RepID=A2CI51_CHLAT|nr:hypothetical chloroplast RF62 [Chlorokybus atmophyticus]ABM87973.1 hypothetical chloroplast RF62 [Chlorokybus atmophyticus]WKT05620.1 hypothetical chloroplast RF62 [Chlorokybus atmophyticus]
MKRSNFDKSKKSDKSEKSAEAPFALFYRINQAIRDRRLFKPNQRILIAASGGQDSICLIKILNQLKSQWNWQLGIAHCDHLWQIDSFYAASHVSQLAENLNIDYYQCITTKVFNNEEKARLWRYKILEQIASSHDYTAIVTAHTASDRTETFLYNLLRGTGPDGLQSLSWKRKLKSGIRIIRPLLSTTRFELTVLAKQLQMPLWPDKSNQDLFFKRNLIRKQLLPYLRSFFNPQIDKTIAQLAELLHAETVYMENIAALIRIKAHKKDDTIAELDTSILKTLPLALQRRVLRQFLYHEMRYRFTFTEIERIRILYCNYKKVQKVEMKGTQWVMYLHSNCLTISRT